MDDLNELLTNLFPGGAYRVDVRDTPPHLEAGQHADRIMYNSSIKTSMRSKPRDLLGIMISSVVENEAACPMLAAR